MKVFTPVYLYYAIIFLFFFTFRNNPAAGQVLPKHEVRAVWLTTIGGLDWPHSYARSERSAEAQKRELRGILDKLKAANVNTVLLQTRVRGTVIYPSVYEPWDGCLSGVPGISPGYDALQFAIDECHRRGMELHAWIVTIPAGKWNSLGCKRLRANHPSAIKRIGNDGYMNPEHSATADYLAGMCREITENYDVDGIHLDYIRYPETWNLRVSREEGRRNITRIVRRIYNDVKSLKPWVKISCSPIGKHDDLTRYRSHGWNARTKVCQDAQEWLRTGIMDELFPMMYFRGNQFYPFALDWKENCYGRIVAAGLGIYFMSPEERDWNLDEIKRQMYVLRRHGMGHAYFRSAFFTDNIKGVYDFAATQADAYPALVPPMTWQSAVCPLPPLMLNVKRTADGDLLTWSGAKDLSGGPYLIYNVYSSTTWPVDINDARNLIATRCTGHTLLAGRRKSDNTQRYYSVTAMDRYGNESKPVSTAPEKTYKSDKHLIMNDGRTLMLPGKSPTIDAEYLTIETLQGSIVDTQRYDSRISIAHLPEGMYVLRTLGRKGVTHRIGFFIIRRNAPAKR